MEFFVFLWILFGIATAVVANNKGHNIYTHFIGGLLLGPFGLIFALVQPKNQEKIDEKKVKTGKFKKCPKCAELIKVEANICRFCNHVF